MEANALKLDLIQKIMSIQDNNQLLEIASVFKRIWEEKSLIQQEKVTTSTTQLLDDTLLQSLTRPMKKTMTIEELVVEQNYSPIQKEDFYKKAAQLNIEEPLEDLLDQLNQ